MGEGHKEKLEHAVNPNPRTQPSHQPHRSSPQGSQTPGCHPEVSTGEM